MEGIEGRGPPVQIKKTKKKNKTILFFLAYSPRRQEGEGPEGGRTHPCRIQGQLGNTKHSASEPSRTHGGERAESRDLQAHWVALLSLLPLWFVQRAVRHLGTLWLQENWPRHNDEDDDDDDDNTTYVQ